MDTGALMCLFLSYMSACLGVNECVRIGGCWLKGIGDLLVPGFGGYINQHPPILPWAASRPCGSGCACVHGVDLPAEHCRVRCAHAAAFCG